MAVTLFVFSPLSEPPSDTSSSSSPRTNYGFYGYGTSGVHVDASRGESVQGNSEPLIPGESRAELGRAAPPVSADMGCSGQLSAGRWSGSDLCPYRFGAVHVPEEVPAIDLLYHALAQTQVTSAGLKVEPWIRTYVGVPTLVHAASPTRQEVVRVFEHDIVVTFEATSFKYDFGDGSVPLVTTDPSSGYPVMTLHHVYRSAMPEASVVLETTWNASMTHPVTGEKVSVPSALLTVERSNPFEVRKAKGYLTDTAEELRGR